MTDRLRLVIDAAPSAMIVVNGAGQVVVANSEAERSFGYTHDELLALRVEDLIPSRFRGHHDAKREAYFVHPDRRGMGVGRELFGLRKDGTEMPVEIGLNPIEIDDERFVLASIIDITERLRGQAAENAARDDVLRRSILDTIPFCIIATDAQGQVVTANPAAESLLGYRQEELVGRSITEIDAVERARYSDGTPALSRVDGDEGEWTYRHKDGRTIPVCEAIVPLEGDGGFILVSYDIAHRIEARERVEHMATHDGLTNLPNRSLLLRHLDHAFEAVGEAQGQVALLLLDLDHFKRVNDSLGHHIGDELLVVIAERLLMCVRNDDMVARLGGDEFVVVMHDLDPGADLDQRLDELLKAVVVPVVVHGYELAVTVSIGATLYPADGDDPASLLKHADIAMYAAKSTGRNRVRWFEHRMLDDNNGKLSLSAALRQAIDQDELSLAYQPQVDLASGLVVGVEALARWNSPSLGPVPPDQFIPVAEDGGMIAELGDWALRTACTALAQVQAELGRPLRLAVNVSPRQLRGEAWLSEIADALEASGLEPKQLEVEITEGILIEDHGDVVAMLDSLRSLGVSIVVDDFGCGYSSLAYLTKFPIDKIKIDRSFVQEITSPHDEAAIVDAIIVMAHALGMAVVAEGVETEIQETYLRERGCDEVQGYRYSPGVPVADVVRIAQQVGCS
ncbi:EAL domain-containing protein [Nocardioides sp. WS12]|uniref:putative bifunctional diguanylate cyclase/phosphodiesterase n=1 Tax=Nocardioides sp. WS12 TaxID=2486272 RepID=UPI0015FDEAA5|nr:EAL domain-containing protein [Nocardioides sp. WS12]